MIKRVILVGATALAFLSVASAVPSIGSGLGRSIQFEDAPAAAVFVNVSLILDAFVQKLEALDGFPATVDIGTGVVDERCGDDDGCHFRLFIRDPDGSLPPRVKNGFLTFEGAKWRLGATETTGDISDSAFGSIADVTLASDICFFSDDASNSFRLLADPSVSSDVECVLRIDD